MLHRGEIFYNKTFCFLVLTQFTSGEHIREEHVFLLPSVYTRETYSGKTRLCSTSRSSPLGEILFLFNSPQFTSRGNIREQLVLFDFPHFTSGGNIRDKRVFSRSLPLGNIFEKNAVCLTSRSLPLGKIFETNAFLFDFPQFTSREHI